MYMHPMPEWSAVDWFGASASVTSLLVSYLTVRIWVSDRSTDHCSSMRQVLIGRMTLLNSFRVEEDFRCGTGGSTLIRIKKWRKCAECFLYHRTCQSARRRTINMGRKSSDEKYWERHHLAEPVDIHQHDMA